MPVTVTGELLTESTWAPIGMGGGARGVAANPNEKAERDPESICGA